MLNTVSSEINLLLYCLKRCDSVLSLGTMTLPYLDITYCMEGQMEYLFNGKPVTLRAGDAIVFPPGSTRYRYETNVPTYYASFNIIFYNKVDFPVEGKIESCIHADTMLLLETINQAFQSPSPLKKEKCFALFQYLYNQLVETSTNRDTSYIKITKQCIMEHLSDCITIEMLAKAVHLTPQYLCNLFKKETGITIFNYILDQRIDLAKRIIITNQQLPIPEIAEKCGFRDVNYFSNTFKKRVGISPVQYKKINLAKIVY